MLLLVTMVSFFLDGDATPLKDHQGQQIARDIVQFVPFTEVMRKDEPNACVVWLHHVHKAYSIGQSVSIYTLYMPFESKFCSRQNWSYTFDA